MSQDVFDFIIEYANYLGIYLDDERDSFMGLDVEIVLDKKGFIELGYASLKWGIIPTIQLL